MNPKQMKAPKIPPRIPVVSPPPAIPTRRVVDTQRLDVQRQGINELRQQILDANSSVFATGGDTSKSTLSSNVSKKEGPRGPQKEIRTDAGGTVRSRVDYYHERNTGHGNIPAGTPHEHVMTPTTYEKPWEGFFPGKTREQVNPRPDLAKPKPKPKP